jgi:hypothetical protein
MRDRTVLVLELISKPKMVDVISQELAEYSWHSESHLAVVTKLHVLDVLKQFENALLSAPEVRAWANSICGRADIGFEFGADGVVEETLCWLAHPEVKGPIDSALCLHIVALYERRGAKRQVP